MGMKEDLIVDWTNRIMEFQGQKLYIAKQFEYDGNTYLYAILYESLKEESEEILVIFLKKIKDSVFEIVKDEESHNMLLATVAGEFLADRIREKYNNQQNS